MTNVGRYRIERELGRGAMGVVYLADDPRLQRRAALKVVHLPPELSRRDRAEFRARFLREARAAAGLNHPGIVTVFDAECDEAEQTPFIAMEYVDGRSLRDLLDAEGPLDAARAYRIAGDAAAALGAAHRAGIVHRDVKPANLLVRDDDGAVKVADFGVARLPTSELTRDGRVPGSPAYMSPEQIRGRDVDGRSDLFSLAVVLYETMSGRRPFDGDDVSEVAYSVVHETPIPITRLVPGASAALDDFFDRALAKDPSRRFPDASAFRDALARAANSPDARLAEATRIDDPAPWTEGNQGGIAGVPGPRSRRRLRLWAVLALAPLAAALVIAAWRDGVDLRLDARTSFRDATLQVLVDGETVFERDLDAPEQPSGTLGRLKRLIDEPQETFETWIRVEPGQHEIAAVITPRGGDEPFRDSIAVELRSGEKRRLKLVAGPRRLGGTVSLKLGGPEER